MPENSPNASTVLIYALFVKGGPIRYVGKTKNSLSDRLRGHRYDAKRGKLPLHRWGRKHGHDVSAIILEIVPPNEDWRDVERFWIAHFRKEGSLLNVADGGEGWTGGSFSQQHRDRIAAAKRRGRWVSCRQCGVATWAAKSNVKKAFCSKDCLNRWNVGRTHNRPFSAQAIEAAAAKRRAITHCPSGHPYSGDNLAIRGKRRTCRACARAATTAYRNKQKNKR